MNEKLNKALEKILNALTDEQKEKAKACKTLDGLMALLGKEKLELPDELVDAVAGGHCPFDYKMDENGNWVPIE